MASLYAASGSFDESKMTFPEILGVENKGSVFGNESGIPNFLSINR
jgi:hypothetical protein